MSPALEAAAFSLPKGAVSDPVVNETGAVIVKVLDRQDVAPDQLAKEKDPLRTEPLNDRKQKFFAAYMAKARQWMKIRLPRGGHQDGFREMARR